MVDCLVANSKFIIRHFFWLTTLTTVLKVFCCKVYSVNVIKLLAQNYLRHFISLLYYYSHQHQKNLNLSSIITRWRLRFIMGSNDAYNQVLDVPLSSVAHCCAQVEINFFEHDILAFNCLLVN